MISSLGSSDLHELRAYIGAIGGRQATERLPLAAGYDDVTNVNPI
jgi:hypothetical protein